MQEFNQLYEAFCDRSAFPPLTPVSALRGLYPVAREWMQGPAMQEHWLTGSDSYRPRSLTWT